MHIFKDIEFTGNQTAEWDSEEPEKEYVTFNMYIQKMRRNIER